MTLINYPGSDHQMAQISIDAGYARDIMLMLTDAHAVIAGLAGALSEVINWLHQARDHALAGIPPIS